eukprot:9253954-Lingulodinium_polyedra.AAC.1
MTRAACARRAARAMSVASLRSRCSGSVASQGDGPATWPTDGQGGALLVSVCTGAVSFKKARGQ